MPRLICRLLAIAIVCILTLNSHAVHAQGDSDVCVTKADYYVGFEFSPDSKYLVASWDDEIGIARLWDIETGKVRQTFTNTDNSGGLGMFRFSSDKKYLLTANGGMFPYVALWDIRTGDQIYEVKPDGETYSEEPAWISISPDNHYFFIVGDYSLRVYDFATGKQLYRFLAGEGRAWFDWSKDYKYILMWNVREVAEEGVVLLNIDTNKKIWSLDENVWNAQFVGNDQYIAVALWGNPDYSFTLWDASSHQSIHTINLGDSVTRMGLSGDGKYLLIINESNSVLWDTLKGQLLRTFIAPQYPIIISPDSRYVLFALIDQENPEHQVYRLWDIKQNREKPNFHIDNIYPANDPKFLYANDPKFSPNGRYLLTGVVIPEQSVSYRLWDIKLNRDKLDIQIEQGDPIEFSPNNKYLVASSREGLLRLWNIETGEELHLDC